MVWMEVLWKIENFSFCWQKKGEQLSSSPFSVDDVFWHLKLTPKGGNLGNEIILNVDSINQNFKFCAQFEFGILDRTNAAICTSTARIESSYGSYRSPEPVVLIKEDELNIKKSEILSTDVFTIRCRITKTSENARDCPIKYVLKTRIKVEPSFFAWNIPNFSKVKQEKSSNHIFKIAKSALFDIVFMFNENDEFVKVVFENYKTRSSWLCKIKFAGSKDFFVLKSCMKMENECYIKPQIAYQDIVSKQGLLKDDVLQLDCEFYFIDHNLEQFTVMCSDLPSFWTVGASILTQPSAEIENKQNVESNLLQKDFLKLYQEEALSDFDIQVQEKVFPVHSLVLAARSPVFRQMLESEMSEKKSRVSQIEDLDEEIVDQMLKYIYSDDLGKITWENVFQLYYASDKYELSGMKKILVNFMQKNLNSAHVCQVLELADRHKDEELKKSAVNYLTEHEAQVFLSPDWKSVITRNPELTSLVMLRIFELKYK